MDKLQTFVSLFDYAPLPMSYSPLDGDGRLLASFWNQSWFECFGYQPDAVQGRTGDAFGLWPDMAFRADFLQAVGADGISKTETTLRSADGSLRTVIVSARKMFADDTTLMVVSYEDVTEQRELESARRQAERTLRLFQEMVESSADAIMIIEDHRVIACNTAATRLYGMPRERLIGSHPAELSPEYQDDGESSYSAAVRLMERALAGSTEHFLWRHRRGDGSTFMADVVLNPAIDLGTDHGERGRRYVTVVRDVTEEQQAARALQDSEQRFRKLFRLAPVGLALTEAEGKVFAINRHWTQLFGYTLDDIPDTEAWWKQAYPDPAYRDAVRAKWAQATARITENDGELESAEYLVTCKDGQQRHVLIGGALIGNEVLTSYIDVTAQREARAQLQALNQSLETRVLERTRDLEQAIEDLRLTQHELVRSEKLAGLGALVAGVAHELNTPIGNAVMVASTLGDLRKRFETAVSEGLRRSVLDSFLGELREASDMIEHNLRRAAELITSFKQVAVDQSSYQRRSFGIAETLHELRMTLNPTLRRAGVTLVEDIPPDLRMDSYPGPLSQVLMNIVNNAVVHAFDGRPGGTVRISGTALPGDRVRIQISDDGCGIDPDKLPRIFDPFFTTKLGRGGSGLGLHIVYTLVTELLGGSVRIESEPGTGSHAIIELPLSAPPPRAAPGDGDLPQHP